MDNQRFGCHGHMASPVSHRQMCMMWMISNCFNLVTEKIWEQFRNFIKMFCWQRCSAMPCHQLVSDTKKLLSVWAFCNFSNVICTFCIVNNCCYSFFSWVINIFVDNQANRTLASFHLAMTHFCSLKCVTNIVAPWDLFIVRDLTIVHTSMLVQ